MAIGQERISIDNYGDARETITFAASGTKSIDLILCGMPLLARPLLTIPFSAPHTHVIVAVVVVEMTNLVLITNTNENENNHCLSITIKSQPNPSFNSGLIRDYYYNNTTTTTITTAITVMIIMKPEEPNNYVTT